VTHTPYGRRIEDNVFVTVYPGTIRSEIEETTEDRNPRRKGFEISRCEVVFLRLSPSLDAWKPPVEDMWITHV